MLNRLIMFFVYTDTANKRIHFWLGGSDVNKNGEYIWITGRPMPMGSPFWGVDERLKLNFISYTFSLCENKIVLS